MLLSTIIPVYNTKSYLNKTVDSIIAQKMPEGEHEIILIDDGSTDGSGAICDEYALSYPNLVRVIHETNAGVSCARNLGIVEAKGKYIHFMDSDDWMIPGSYRCILDNYYDDRFDYIGFGSVTLDRVMCKKWKDTFDLNGSIRYEGRGRLYCCKGNILPFSVMGWYRKSFMINNQIEFDCKSIISEDVQFNLRFMMADPLVRLTSVALYRYEVRGDSAVSERNPIKMRKMADSYMTLFDVIKSYQKCYPEFEEGGNMIIYEQMIPFTSRILSAGYTEADFKHIRNKLIQMDILPLCSKGKIFKAMNFIYSNTCLYPFASIVYRKIFVPFILPRLSRN